MSSFTKFNQFAQDIARKQHDLGADTLKFLLTNTAPDAANNKVKADIVGEIAPAAGYLAGGAVATLVSAVQALGVLRLILNPVVFGAVGGQFGPFRYAVLYNATATGNPLIGFYDYGAPVTVTDGNSFVANLDGTNGVLQIS